MENMAAIELQARPTYYGQKGRALVWFYRAQSAYRLAERITGADAVTVDEYQKAAKLLDSVQRYALADVHQWEWANTSERYCNSEQAEEDEARLDRRRARLQKALTRYGLRLVNYGLYPAIVDADGNPQHLTHYFD